MAQNAQIKFEDSDLQITNLLSNLFHHPCSPKWNHFVDDHLSQIDINKLKYFHKTLVTRSNLSSLTFCNSGFLRWVENIRNKSPFFFHRLYAFDLSKDSWHEIPTTCRENIANNLEEIIPNNAPLEELRIYYTSGTTGHPLVIPHSRFSVASYQVFLESLLHMSGINYEFNEDRAACFLLSTQAKTVTYATTLSYWNNAGFAKLNLHKSQWKRDFDSAFYISEFNPLLINGDPIAFSNLLELDLDISPKALVSTSSNLSDGLKQNLENKFHCPVLDLYSLTETGPIACKFPNSSCYKIIARDILVECLDPNGHPVKDNEIGEITITGGRNPFLPLIRYRTGDFARIIKSKDGELFLYDLVARKPVLYKSANNSDFNSADISACLRPFPIVQYDFIQNKDLRSSLRLRVIDPQNIPWLCELKIKLSSLLGRFDLLNIEILDSLDQ